MAGNDGRIRTLCIRQVMPNEIGNHREEFDCLQFQRLTQIAIRLQQSDANTAMQALAILSAAFPVDAQIPTRWPRCKILQPHAFHLLALYGEDDQETALAMHNLASNCYDLGDFVQARQLQERVLTIINCSPQQITPLTLDAMTNLAATLKQLGELNQARELEEQALQMSRKILGAAHSSTLTTMNNLAISLFQSGEQNAGLEMMEASYQLSLEHLGAEHPNTLSTQQSLANMNEASRPCH